MLGRSLGRNIAGRPLCLYYDDEYREVDAHFEPCMPIRRELQIAGLDVRQLPGGRACHSFTAGAMRSWDVPMLEYLRYAKQQNYRIELPTREVYHKGPGMFFRGNPQKYLTEIQLLVTAP